MVTKRLTKSKFTRTHTQQSVCSVSFCAALLISVALSQPLVADSAEVDLFKSANGNDNDIVHFFAREVTYDAEKNLVEARGRVTAIWKGQTVRADILRYDTETDRIYTYGNVELTNADGTVIKTDRVELSGDFKEATTEKLVARLPNGALIAAKSSKRTEGRYNRFYNAAYTACDQCLQSKDKKPLWMIKSKQVTHDEQNKYITAKDITFDVYGQPILWSPWFGYPDPTVKRKTGILSPSFGFDSDQGAYAGIPLFIVINDYADVTLTPIVYTENNPRLAARYRQRFSGGGFDIQGSITSDDNNAADYGRTREFDPLRWDIDSSFWWQLAPQWYLSSNVRLASDRDYLDDYDIDTDVDKAGFLQSDITLERRGYDSWFQANALYFQTEDTNINQDYVPTVLPEISFDWQSPKDRFGGNSYFTANTRSLYRDLYIDTSVAPNVLTTDTPKSDHRFMANAGWNGHWIGLMGEEYQFDASLAALSWINDEYYVNGTDFSGSETQLRPMVKGEFSYPLVRYAPSNTITIEPVIQAVWSPDYNQDDYRYIPNEDSQTFELTASNLFTPNRFSGFDRDEGGLRFNYGLRGSLQLNNGGYSRFQIGQVWRPTYDGEFDENKNSGLDGEFSDIVAQLEFQPTRWLDLSANGRFDEKDFTMRRLDVGGAFGPQSLKFSGYYTWFDDLENLTKTEEVRIGLSTKISDQLKLSGYMIHDFQREDNMRPKEARLSLSWENECIALGTYYKRKWKADGVEDNSFWVQFSLKTLGDLNLSL
ncbi:MAG: LPS-assembly protein LptD [Alphaproteobacteria bacterium]